MMDNWKHRSLEMKCRTCMWFAEKETNDPVAEKTLSEKVFGRCRRHSPTMNGYPVVFSSDWCGDHKLDEEK